MFRVGNPVTGKDFYDRTRMIGETKALIKAHQNFMIKAPRRYGKTSLIKEVMLELKTDYLYIDLRRTPRLNIVIEQIMNYAYSQAGVIGFMKGIKDNAMAFIRNSKHSIKIDIEVLEYSVEFFLAKKEPFECFSEALNTLEKIGDSLHQKFIVVFDEFQDINRLNYDDVDLLEVLRGTIQHHKSTTFVFLGSVEHLMTQIFENKASPFYNFCRKFKLEPFDIKELSRQLEKTFQKIGVGFEARSDLETTLHKLGGHPANTMLTMQKLLLRAEKEKIVLIRGKELNEAYESAFEESLDLVEQYIIEINKKKHYHDVIYRLANKENQILTASALHQVLSGLSDLGYVFNIGWGEYIIVDGFLKKYLQTFE